MSRIVVVVLAAVTLSLLTVAAPSNACTGCPPDWNDVREGARSMFIARATAVTSPDSYQLAAATVLIGASPNVVMYSRVDGEPPMPPGTRWVVTTDIADKGLASDPSVLNGRWDRAFRVDPDGTIHWGLITGAPPTIGQLLAFFGLPPTDAVFASPAGSPIGDATVLGLGGALGFIVAWGFSKRRWSRFARVRHKSA